MYRAGSNAVAPEQLEQRSEGRRLLRRVFSSSPHIFAPAKTILLQAGEKPSQLLQIYSGWAIREVSVPQSQRALLALYMQGDCLGLEGITSSLLRDNIVAQTDMSYQSVPMTTVRQLLEQNPPCAHSIMDLIVRDKELIDDLAVGLSRCSAEVRIAAFLVRIFDRLREKQMSVHRSFRLPLTQQDIGDHLGLTMVHVNRVLKELRMRSAVLVRHQAVVILDLKLLRRIATGEEKPKTTVEDSPIAIKEVLTQARVSEPVA